LETRNRDQISIIKIKNYFKEKLNMNNNDIMSPAALAAMLDDAARGCETDKKADRVEPINRNKTIYFVEIFGEENKLPGKIENYWVKYLTIAENEEEAKNRCKEDLKEHYDIEVNKINIGVVPTDERNRFSFGFSRVIILW